MHGMDLLLSLKAFFGCDRTGEAGPKDTQIQIHRGESCLPTAVGDAG